MSPNKSPNLPKFVYYLGALLVLLLAAEWLLYSKIDSFTSPEKKTTAIDPKVFLLNVNEIPFRSADGVELHGWLIPGKVGYPAFIIAHNYGSDRAQTLGALEGLVAELNKQGYFVFLYDSRGHGSSGSRSYLGYKEANDMEAALREVLKYKQIGRRIGVLGIGMGAVAAIQACKRVDETKLIILDSVYDEIPGRITDSMTSAWPARDVLRKALLPLADWNLRWSLKIDDTKMQLERDMPGLYPRAVLFAENNPPSAVALRLYNAAKEPKELLQMGVTASEDLMGDARTRYKDELLKKIMEYFPAANDQQMLEIAK